MSFVFGVLLVLVGLPFLILGLLGTAKSAWEGNGNDTLVFIVLAALGGLFCVWTGVRMIGGSKRKDGGLLSPLVLRIGGLYFLLVPLIMFLSAGEVNWRSLLWILELGFYLVVAATCFALASKRQLPVLDQESVESDT